MTSSPITVEATLQADGVTLRLAQKVNLPPGPVQVTVQPARSPSGPTMRDVLDRIHRDHQQRGHKPLTDEGMAAEIAALRSEEEEEEERWRAIWSQTRTGAVMPDRRHVG
jgi:hypothetical protein